MPRKQIEVKFKVAGTLEDRSGLSDEMADLCEKLPIYIVVEGEVDSTQTALQPTKTEPGKRKWKQLKLKQWWESLSVAVYQLTNWLNRGFAAFSVRFVQQQLKLMGDINQILNFLFYFLILTYHDNLHHVAPDMISLESL